MQKDNTSKLDIIKQSFECNAETTPSALLNIMWNVTNARLLSNLDRYSYMQLQEMRTYFNQIIDAIDEQITKRIESSILKQKETSPPY